MFLHLKISVSLLFILLCLISCGKQCSSIETILSNPVHFVETHPLHAATTTIDKIGKIPDTVLNQIIEWDNDSTYFAYIPDSVELALIADMISLLPPLNFKAMEERLAGIYFVENFRSNGMMDFARDSSGLLHFYLVFNPELLKNSVSEVLNNRLLSCFVEDSSGVEIEIMASDSVLGFFATLLHETTHAADLVYQISPYLFPVFPDITISNDTDFTFARLYWKEYSVPKKEYDFRGRDSITAYGFDGGPKIPIGDSKKLVSGFSQTPFASLYGSVNWAEDLAEMVTWYHLTSVLNTEYKIVVRERGEVVLEYRPMDSEKVRKRVPLIERFYNKKQQLPPAVKFGI